MTVDRGALNDDRGEVTEGTDFSLFVHLRCSCRTAQHNLRHYTRSPDRPTHRPRPQPPLRRQSEIAKRSLRSRPSASVDLAVTAVAAVAAGGGGVADTSNQETLQNRTNEQNGGGMGRAQSMSGIWTILCHFALCDAHNPHQHYTD